MTVGNQQAVVPARYQLFILATKEIVCRFLHSPSLHSRSFHLGPAAWVHCVLSSVLVVFCQYEYCPFVGSRSFFFFFLKSLVVFKLFSLSSIFYSFVITCFILGLLLSSCLELTVLSQSESTFSILENSQPLSSNFASLSFLSFSPSMTPIRCILYLFISSSTFELFVSYFLSLYFSVLHSGLFLQLSFNSLILSSAV